MSAAAAQPLVSAQPAHRAPPARLAALVVLSAVAVLAAVLLAASLVPNATLATRLLGAAGESRNGSFTQELVAHLGERLRLTALLLGLLAAGLALVRGALEELIGATIQAAAWPTRLPHVTTIAIVGVTTLIALAVRIPFLSQPMRYDEALTFNEFASRPLYYALSFYPDPNNHLLNTLLMHTAYVGLGNQPWVLRLPALLGGVLLVPATYALARLLFGSGAAFLSAVLVAVSSYLIEYSTNGRGYTLQALCFVTLLALVVVAARRASLSALVGAALIAALGAYALPTMLYGVAIAGLWLIVELRRAKVRRIRPAHLVASALVLGLAVVVAYLPVLVVSGPDKLASNRFVVPLELSELAAELPRSLASTWALWNRDVPLALALLLVIGFAIGSWRAPLGVLAAGVCLVLVLVQRVAPFERVWLFLLPLYLVIASGGLARFVDGRLLGIGFGAVIGFFTLTNGSITTSTDTGVYPDAEAVARTLGPRLAPDDAVMTTLPASLPELQYYFPRTALPTNVLVRSPDDAQNLWIITAPGAEPDLGGWRTRIEVERFPHSSLFELKR